MNNADGCQFNQGHLWCRERNDGVLEVGISDHAQQSLGEIMYFELPEPGTEIVAGESFGTVESVKVVNDLIGPITGAVVELNPAVETDPSIANRDPYGEGWLLKVKCDGEVPAELMDPESYSRYLQGQ